MFVGDPQTIERPTDRPLLLLLLVLLLVVLLVLLLLLLLSNAIRYRMAAGWMQLISTNNAGLQW